MSFKNMMLLDKDFALRHRSGASTDFAKGYPFRVALKRKNRNSSRPYWDIHWRGAVHKAADELNAQHVNINDGAFFQTAEVAEKVKSRAEEIWRAPRR
jgi:hypothetical protein